MHVFTRRVGNGGSKCAADILSRFGLRAATPAARAAATRSRRTFRLGLIGPDGKNRRSDLCDRHQPRRKRLPVWRRIAGRSPTSRHRIARHRATVGPSWTASSSNVPCLRRGCRASGLSRVRSFFAPERRQRSTGRQPRATLFHFGLDQACPGFGLDSHLHNPPSAGRFRAPRGGFQPIRPFDRPALY